MLQALKIYSRACLTSNQQGLKSLKVEDMEATRPEDKAEILDAIADKEGFNTQLQTLLFDDLLPSWHLSDFMAQMDRIGYAARWAPLMDRVRGSEGHGKASWGSRGGSVGSGSSGSSVAPRSSLHSTDSVTASLQMKSSWTLGSSRSSGNL
jgi:hypothetical protein